MKIDSKSIEKISFNCSLLSKVIFIRNRDTHYYFAHGQGLKRDDRWVAWESQQRGRVKSVP